MKLRLLILFLLIATINFGQDLKIKKYSMRDGILTNEIFGAAEDSLGYLWIATSRGITKYNGKEWELIAESHKIPVLPYSKIIVDDKNSLWAVSDVKDDLIVNILPENSDVYRLDDLDLLQKDEAVKELKVKYTDNSKTIFMLTNFSNILKFENNKWIRLKLKENFSEIFSIENYRNKIIISTNKGIFELNDENISELKIIEDGHKNKIRYLKKIKKDDNEILFMLGDNYLYKSSNGQTELLNNQFKLQKYFSRGSLYYLAQNQRGYIFFGDKTKFYCLNTKNEIINDYLDIKLLQYAGGISLIADSEDILWLSTLRGLYKIIQSPFTKLKGYDFINHEEVSSLYYTKTGKMVIGQYGKISVYQNGRLETYKLPGDEFLNNTSARVMDITEDSDGNIWFVVSPNGLFKLENNKLKWFSDYSNDQYSTLYIDNNNEVIVGLFSGLVKVDGDSLKKIDNDIKHIRRIKKISNDEFAVCTSKEGIYLKNKTTFDNYQSSIPLLNETYDIFQIDEEKYWVATKAGLAELNRNKNTLHRIFSREITEQIYSINIDSNQAIWLGTNNGYIKIKDEKIIKFTTSLGLAGSEANRAAFAINNNNDIWLGTDKGLSIYNEKYGQLPIANSKCVITSLMVNGEKIKNLNELIVVPHDGKIEIDYRGLSFIDESILEYNVKLYNSKNKLVLERITNRNFIDLFLLNPGKYRLYIWSTSPFSLERNNPASIEFFVESDFYRTNWFYLMLVLASFVLAYSLNYLIGQRRYSKNLEKDVELKTAKLIEEIDQKNELAGKLMKSEEKFKGFFDHSVVGIFQIDLTGKLLTVNSSFTRLLGYSSNPEIEELPVIGSFAEDKNRYNALFKKVVEDKFIIGKKIKVKKIDGSIIYVRCNARLIEDDLENIFIEGTLEDITKSVDAENALIIAKQKAEDSEKIKTEFLAQMSHEIRTPINVILSFSQLLKEEMNEKFAEYDDFFIGMDKAGRRIIRTVDLLLNVSELQTGGYDYNPKNISLYDEIINPLLFEYNSLAKDKKLELIVECENDIKVFGDEYTVTQILANLVDNAIKYTNDGFVKIFVKDSDGILVTVMDSGIGIAEEYIPKLFNPFSQEEQGYTRKYEGNGLGLTLVKKYCDLNGAEINVKSKKGEGTAITVLFKKAET